MPYKKIIKVLLIEDEEYDVRRVNNTIKPFDSQIKIMDVVSTGNAAIELLKSDKKNYDVVIMDFQIAGGLSGEKLIKKIKNIDSSYQIIVITKMTINITDFEFANKLIEAGAMWYCTKYPGDIEEYIYQPTDFLLSIFNAFEKKKLEKEKLKVGKKLSQNVKEILERKPIIGSSDSAENIRNQVLQCSEHESTVFISGSSGTGKELVASQIHFNSERKYEKFVPINCGSLPHDLIESELFGFEKGAFTGASIKKKGLFEVANNGTIFLDEIAELPKTAQVKLLRVLQDGEIDKIGRTEKIKVDVRVIAATNKNIINEMEEKRFREDLYYRLNVVSLMIPPLKERKEDIPDLVYHFLEKYSRDMSKESPVLNKKAIELLSNHNWPGNVRELQNVIQRLIISGVSNITKMEVENALGIKIRSQNVQLHRFDSILPWREMERKMRKDYFQFVRGKSNSDAETARKLGLAPPNYYRMCKELGLK